MINVCVPQILAPTESFVVRLSESTVACNERICANL